VFLEITGRIRYVKRKLKISHQIYGNGKNMAKNLSKGHHIQG
jgi:hypothetical protein